MAFQQPTPQYREPVFVHTPVSDERGWGAVELENPTLGLGLRLVFDKATLPYLVEWKMMGEGLYVLGIEPTNCGVVGGRAAAREQGALPYLAAGASRHYSLEVDVIEYP